MIGIINQITGVNVIDLNLGYSLTRNTSGVVSLAWVNEGDEYGFRLFFDGPKGIVLNSSINSSKLKDKGLSLQEWVDKEKYFFESELIREGE